MALSTCAGEGAYRREAVASTALSGGEPEAAAYFVLADDRGGVAVADAVLVGEPVGALVTAKEGGPGFQVGEPLRQLAPRNERDASDEAFVGSGGVRQRHRHLRVGSRFQSRLPHLLVPGKTQFATFPQCPVCRFVTIFTSGGLGPPGPGMPPAGAPGLGCPRGRCVPP